MNQIRRQKIFNRCYATVNYAATKCLKLSFNIVVEGKINAGKYRGKGGIKLFGVCYQTRKTRSMAKFEIHLPPNPRLTIDPLGIFSLENLEDIDFYRRKSHQPQSGVVGVQPGRFPDPSQHHERQAA